MDYSPLPIDKHEPEFVSIQSQLLDKDLGVCVAQCLLLFAKGPCRRKLDGIIQGMKDTSRIMALSLYLPNCDRKGFFKRKQVSLFS